MIEPAIPSTVVIMKPRCCAPGMMARAIKPTMKPTMMYEMMCSIDLFWFGWGGYHFAQIDVDSFHGKIGGSSKAVILTQNAGSGVGPKDNPSAFSLPISR